MLINIKMNTPVELCVVWVNKLTWLHFQQNHTHVLHSSQYLYHRELAGCRKNYLNVRLDVTYFMTNKNFVSFCKYLRRSS